MLVFAQTVTYIHLFKIMLVVLAQYYCMFLISYSRICGKG